MLRICMSLGMLSLVFLTACFEDDLSSVSTSGAQIESYMKAAPAGANWMAEKVTASLDGEAGRQTLSLIGQDPIGNIVSLSIPESSFAKGQYDLKPTDLSHLAASSVFIDGVSNAAFASLNGKLVIEEHNAENRLLRGFFEFDGLSLSGASEIKLSVDRGEFQVLY